MNKVASMKRNQIAWWLWAVGSILIALSWFKVVSNTVGWCGFGIGMAGSIVGWGLRPPQSDKKPTTTDKKDENAV